MSDPIRIPLVEDVEPRLVDSDKDGLATNVFYDKTKQNQIYATKRPGITSYASSQGVGLGIFLGYGWTIPHAIWPKLIYGNGKFIAPCQEFYPTGYSNLVLYSEDGVVWSQSTMTENAYWEGITWNGSVYCACSFYTETTDQGSIATSPDGITWTDRTIPDGKFRDVATSNSGQLVAVGGGNQIGYTNSIYSSDNGVTWNSGNLSGNNVAKLVSWNNGASLFLALGNTSVATSPTGATWTNRTAPSGTLVCLACDGTNWFIASQNQAIGYLSSNGTSWTQVTLPAARNWGMATWTGAHFIISDLNSTVLTYSEDGITWQETTMPSLITLGSDISMYSAVAGNGTGTTVALGDGPYYYSYSTNNNISFTLANLNAYTSLPTITP